MLAVIKEIGIFIVIAQAILYFVPGENYVKYVKVLVGIMMIAKLISPVFSLFSGENFDEKKWEEVMLAENMEWVEMKTIKTENYETIYTEIEEELRDKLNRTPPEGYKVEKVLIEETQKEEYRITLIIEAQGSNSRSEEELKQYYEQLLQTKNLQLQIR